MARTCSHRGGHTFGLPHTLAAALAALLAPAATALAQPGGVAISDLGNFAGATSTLQSSSFALTTVAPVAWYKIRLPRITDPHRYLDISTSGAGFGDTEIGLYSSTGSLIATDDDDGAQNYSALSFGITNPGAAGRVPPVAQAGQSAGQPNDGRDGTLSGNPNVGLLGTASDYYIAVTRFDATFANNFGVTPPTGAASNLPFLLTVRMNTPGGQIAPTVSGGDEQTELEQTRFTVRAGASENTVAVTADTSAVGGSPSVPLDFQPPPRGPEWGPNDANVPPLAQLGDFPLFYRASNAIGDVAVDQATLTVRQLAAFCVSGERRIPSTPGTMVYTYGTAQGDVDGPWTTACFNPAQPPTGNDVWFQMFPAQSGTLTLSTCNSDTGFAGTQPDTLLGFSGECGTNFSTCGDDVGGCGLGTRLSNIPVTAGQEYNIAVRSWSGDIVDGKLAVTFTPGCDSIDFNNDTLTPDSGDLDDFLAVLSGGPAACSTFPAPGCNDLDFNNDGFTPDSLDLDAFISRLGGGPCLQ